MNRSTLKPPRYNFAPLFKSSLGGIGWGGSMSLYFKKHVNLLTLSIFF